MTEVPLSDTQRRYEYAEGQRGDLGAQHEEQAGMGIGEQVARYMVGAMKGARWLLKQQNPDGSFAPIEEGVDAYHKIPYALAVTGYLQEAHRLIDWALGNALTPGGDLRGKEVKAQNLLHEKWYIYSNSWMVIGAQRLGRFDYTRRAIAFLLRFLSKDNGGIFSELTFAEAGEGRQDMVSSSKCGSACLYAGLWEKTIHIGDWFVMMLRLQPDIEHILYTCCRSKGSAMELISRCPRGEDPLMYAVDAAKKQQWYFYPGIAMEFLTKLYLATGRKEYLNASESYFDFTTRCADDVYCTDPGGIIGWGSTQMYWITGEEKYRRAAVTAGDFLIRSQHDEGYWKLAEEVYPHRPEARYMQLDITAEYVVWLAEMAQHLGRKAPER